MEDFNEDIKNVCRVLKDGGLVLYPTDTVWGIGCDATDAKAVSRVFSLKQRVDSKAMLVLIDSDVRLQSYLYDVPEIAYELTAVADTPLTVIYQGAKNLAANLVGEDGSIGIRITKEPFSNALCKRFGKPIVSTSANISGNPSPSNFLEIAGEIKNGVDYIVRYRQDDMTKSRPSAIISLGHNNIIKIIRK